MTKTKSKMVKIVLQDPSRRSDDEARFLENTVTKACQLVHHHKIGQKALVRNDSEIKIYATKTDTDKVLIRVNSVLSRQTTQQEMTLSNIWNNVETLIKDVRHQRLMSLNPKIANQIRTLTKSINSNFSDKVFTETLRADEVEKIDQLKITIEQQEAKLKILETQL